MHITAGSGPVAPKTSSAFGPVKDHHQSPLLHLISQDTRRREQGSTEPVR
jgi:hypothetical protein